MNLHPAITKILENKREEVAEAKRITPEAALIDAAKSFGEVRSLTDSLKKENGSVKIIAEIKRASPTAMFAPTGFDPVAIAQSYEAGGAVAISVLTDARFFCGSPLYVPLVKSAVTIPILRKEFIVDKWQLAESAALGADAVLLMAVCFDSKVKFADMFHLAKDFGLEVLVEIHSEDEWRFVEPVKPKLIGINNRDFMSPDLSVDLATTEKLAPIIGGDATLVTESGIIAPDDLRRLKDIVDGFLIGSAFMKEDDPGGSVARFIDAAS